MNNLTVVVTRLVLFGVFSALTLRLVACSSSEIIPPNAPTPSTNPYSLGRVGTSTDIVTTSETGLVLMGGGSDVDAAFRWMIQKSGGGDFVILRASGGNGYNDYVYGFGGLNSVETFLVNSVAAANDSTVIDRLLKAEAVFIAGGDQSRYLALWEGSKVAEAIQFLISEKGIPIGGTSAGCAIMGEYVYSGEKGSITSEEALANPYHEKLTVRKSSLINHPFLNGVITDQHFTQRNRHGRLVAFMARLKQVSQSPVKGIAVDEQTALVIDKDGNYRVMGSNRVLLIQENDITAEPEIKEVGRPLTWSVNQQALRANWYRSIVDPEEQKTPYWADEADSFWYVENGVLFGN